MCCTARDKFINAILAEKNRKPSLERGGGGSSALMLLYREKWPMVRGCGENISRLSPFKFRGEGHARWREKGWESPNADEGTCTVVLFMYMYL